MRLPAGHAKRLFLGFTCSIVFLAAFTVLVAHNTKAESAGRIEQGVDEHSLTIAVPTSKPEDTISFYKKLGFRAIPSLSGGLDSVRMERKGTPYKLEICHDRFSEAGPTKGGVSGLSFPVADLTVELRKLEAQGLSLSEPLTIRNGTCCAALRDPNGIVISLFQQ